MMVTLGNDDDEWDDSSDLTELEEDELEDELADDDMVIDPPAGSGSSPAVRSKASKSPRKKTAKTDEMYTLGHRLSRPNAKAYSTGSLHKYIEDGDLNLNADYQREAVWADKAQSKLIDSLLRNYYVPPLVFAQHRKPNGFDQLTCVDGKQRLTSICRFMDGEIPHIDTKTKKKYWYKEPKNKTGSYILLPELLRKEFEKLQVQCYEIADLTEAEEREIFQRVQMGVHLSTPEKWQALQGPWPTYLNNLRRKYFNADDASRNILGSLNLEVTRAKDFQDLVRIATAVNATLMSSPPLPIPISADQCEITVRSEKGPSAQFKALLEDILDRFLNLVKNPSYKKGFEQPTPKVAPVELVMIALLIGKHLVLSDLQMADAIFSMRKYIRQNTEKGYLMYKPKILESAVKWIREYKAPTPPSAVPSQLKKNKKRKSDAGVDTSDEEPLAARNVRQKTSKNGSVNAESSITASTSRLANGSTSLKKSSTASDLRSPTVASSVSKQAPSTGNNMRPPVPSMANAAQSSISKASTGPVRKTSLVTPSPVPRAAALPRVSDGSQGKAQRPSVSIPKQSSRAPAQSPQVKSAQVLPSPRAVAATLALTRSGPTLDEEIAELEKEITILVDSERASGSLTGPQADQKRLKEEKLQKLRSDLFVQQMMNAKAKKPTASSGTVKKDDIKQEEGQRQSLFGAPSGALARET